MRRRSGGQFDPAAADAFLAGADEWLSGIEAGSVWERVLEAEPGRPLVVAPSRLDDVARSFADFVDLKTSFARTHSSGVANLAEAAGRELGLGETDRTLLRRAALLHDLGRVSVPNGIWDKPGSLSGAEWERVRLHAYYSERILCQSPVLAPLARIAGTHHERLDGSGYHRGEGGALTSVPARALAAADAYHAMTEARAHRAALSPDEACRTLEGEASRGRLDREAVAAVLAAAGHEPRKIRSSWPAGLTDREVQVLRIVALGRSNKEVAGSLGISPRTVQHHLLHIYQKIGMSTRAGATLFAMENDLLRREG